jgi:hypothetical protein
MQRKERSDAHSLASIDPLETLFALLICLKCPKVCFKTTLSDSIYHVTKKARGIHVVFA